jgi:hypothetical protein
MCRASSPNETRNFKRFNLRASKKTSTNRETATARHNVGDINTSLSPFHGFTCVLIIFPRLKPAEARGYLPPLRGECKTKTAPAELCQSQIADQGTQLDLRPQDGTFRCCF